MADDYQIELWRDEFQQTFYHHTGTHPIILPGTRPIVDLQVLKVSDYHSVWFWYRLDSYTPNYLKRFLQICVQHGVVAYISTANQLSENIGIPVWERDIPSIWITALEKTL